MAQEQLVAPIGANWSLLPGQRGKNFQQFSSALILSLARQCTSCVRTPVCRDTQVNESRRRGRKSLIRLTLNKAKNASNAVGRPNAAPSRPTGWRRCPLFGHSSAFQQLASRRLLEPCALAAAQRLIAAGQQIASSQIRKHRRQTAGKRCALANRRADTMWLNRRLAS